MSMSGQALADLRARNRAALGLSGLGACCASCERGGPCAGAGTPKGLAGLAEGIPGGFGIPAIGITTSFPPVSVAWAPGQTTPVSQEGPGWGDWVLRHVVRPVVDVGGIRVAPFEAEANYSWLANLLALLGGAGAVAAGTYVLARAFGVRK